RGSRRGVSYPLRVRPGYWRRSRGEPVRSVQCSASALQPYLVVFIIETAATEVYTAIGGIKAVIWTDVIQACLMFGGALIAIGTLLYHVGGFHAVAQAVPEMTRLEGYFKHGFEASAVSAFQTEHHIASMGFWDYVKLSFTSE